MAPRIKQYLFIMSLSFMLIPQAQGLSLDHGFSFVAPKSLKSWTADSSYTDLKWKLDSSARRFERLTDDSTIFQTRANLVAQFKFYKELRFYGDFGAVFQTGRSQSRYGDLSPRSGVYINDSYFLISPFAGKKDNEILNLEIGAIGQDRTVGNSVLVRGGAFPGVSEKLHLKAGDLSFKLRAQQLIPYSQTQESELREKESTPYLLTESAEISYRKSLFNLKLKFGLFNYSDLPSQVAGASCILGNSVVGDNLNARFRYDFKGWFANAGVDFLIKKLLLELRVNLVENDQAASRYNRGHEYKLNVFYQGEETAFGPSFRIFSIEPDVAPAFYNSNFLGNTNREGFGIKFSFLKLKGNFPFQIFAEYVDADLLNKELNLFQEDQKLYLIGLTTKFKKVGI